MTTFRHLTARSPQNPRGRACKNKILAKSANDSSDAHNPNDLDDPVDPGDSLMPSWASCPSAKDNPGPDCRGPRSGPEVINSS